MKIKIGRGIGVEEGVFAPVDPQPPIDINDLFELESFVASTTSFEPFDDVEIEWSIRSRDPDNIFSDYVFSLVATEGIAIADMQPTGSITIAPFRNTLVRVRGRRRGSGGGSTLGIGIALEVDESRCQVIEVIQQLFDAQVFSELTNVTSANAELRLRDQPADPTDYSTWTAQGVGYHFPLEIVINNFFNADLALDLDLRFAVRQDESGAELEVTVDHDSNVDFSTLEDIASLGSSTIVAKTLNKVLPLLFECETKKMERDIIRSILGIPAVRQGLETGRLLAVRIVPLGNFTHLAIVICPQQQDRIDRPKAPKGGVIIG